MSGGMGGGERRRILMIYSQQKVILTDFLP